MESLLEKITLYDILGYFVPGSIFLLIGGAEYVIKCQTHNLEILKDFSGAFLLCFIVCAFVCGCILSELSRRICDLWITDKIKEKVAEEIDRDSIKAALVKSGKISTASEPDTTNENIDIPKYFDSIFADIQVDRNYSRIHNYASTAGLNKNLSMAFILGDIVHIVLCALLIREVNMKAEWIFFIVVGLCALVSYFRYRRFEKKTKRYAIEWYTIKYK